VRAQETQETEPCFAECGLAPAHVQARIFQSPEPRWRTSVIKSNKNDAADAQAICEAMSRPVPVGMILMGRHWEEATIYRAAHALQQSGVWRGWQTCALGRRFAA
jgi:Asp-tRNA(Asn)/Glu-tRNA(Gln) amidotransferase A subunit family amidase